MYRSYVRKRGSFKGFAMGSVSRQLPGFVVGLLAGGAVVALAFQLLLPKQKAFVPISEAVPPVWQPAPESEPVELPPLPPSKSPASAEEHVPLPEGGNEEGTGSEAPGTRETPAGESAFTQLEGRVVYGDLREPLPGILVKFSHEGKYYGQCLTNESGAFSIGLSRPGEWNVVALPYGTKGYQVSAKVTGGAPGEVFTELHVPARLDFQVSGRVTDEEERGIDGVQVSLRCYQFDSTGNTSPSETTTTGGGDYILSGILGLLKPMPRSPQSVEDDRFGWPWIEGLQSRQIIHLDFHHPDYGSQSEDLSDRRGKGEKIVVNVRLNRPGIVSGFVVAPGGETVDGENLFFRIQTGSGYSGASTEIKGERFSIKVEGAGILIIYGRVGKYSVVPLTVGPVDSKTVKKGVRVELELLEELRIPLVDHHGTPLVLGDRHLWIEVEGDAILKAELFHGPEAVKDGKFVLPCRPKKSFTIKFSGQGIVTKFVVFTPERIPEQIVLEVLLPLMRGTVLVPPDVKASDLSVTVESKYTGGSSCRSGGNPDIYDESTGAFEIFRDGDEDARALYTVTFTVPGYKPWVKSSFRVKKDETLEEIEVTFEK